MSPPVSTGTTHGCIYIRDTCESVGSTKTTLPSGAGHAAVGSVNSGSLGPLVPIVETITPAGLPNVLGAPCIIRISTVRMLTAAIVAHTSWMAGPTSHGKANNLYHEMSIDVIRDEKPRALRSTVRTVGPGSIFSRVSNATIDVATFTTN